MLLAMISEICIETQSANELWKWCNSLVGRTLLPDLNYCFIITCITRTAHMDIVQRVPFFGMQ